MEALLAVIEPPNEAIYAVIVVPILEPNTIAITTESPIAPDPYSF